MKAPHAIPAVPLLARAAPESVAAPLRSLAYPCESESVR
jgi:hypothetical protein